MTPYPILPPPCGPLPRKLRPAGRLTLLVAVLACLFLAVIPAAAQDPVPSDLYRERPRNEGNRIAFCLRPIGALAAFEADLADAIGQVLLTEVRVHTVAPQNFPIRPTGYDYLFGLTYEQVFILMAERCDVIMGMYLSPQSPEWLRLSRPYLTAAVVGVTMQPGIAEFTALAPGARVGVQALTPADAALSSYTDTLSKGAAPERVIFRDNRSLANALVDHRIDAALIWEGALMAASHGDPAGAGLRVMGGTPFPIPPVQVGAAVRAPDVFLGAQIDQAITALEADGTLADLAARHGIVLAGAS
ncbi:MULTISPECIES: substrate-binding periplasmic protein [unclassified Haematobacter]|uniref:substrate-binding periplasmic protein n=1 Tax=unclassified Haematobacter TaxID=2640585 RepID=UPI0025C13EB2|nr:MULTISPECIES: transporter substrate-binding domain-containing protein [unclassified Haematobacter]